MLKARFLLFMILILSGIGYVFAKNARREDNRFYKLSTNGKCTVPVWTFLTTVPQPGQIGLGQTTYFTTPVLGPCPATTVYTVE